MKMKYISALMASLALGVQAQQDAPESKSVIAEHIGYREYPTIAWFLESLNEDNVTKYKFREEDIGKDLNRVGIPYELEFNAHRSWIERHESGHITGKADGEVWMTFPNGVRAFAICSLGAGETSVVLLDEEWLHLAIPDPVPANSCVGYRTNRMFWGAAVLTPKFYEIYLSRDAIAINRVCVGKTKGVAIFWEHGDLIPDWYYVDEMTGCATYVPRGIAAASWMMSFTIPGWGEVIEEAE